MSASELSGVSCVCVAEGGSSFLPEAIESFLRQDYEGLKELVIVNDRGWEPALPEHPEIRWVAFPRPFRTRGELFNAAFALARYDVHFPWREDEIHLPGRISHGLLRLGSEGHLYLPGLSLVLEGGSLLAPVVRNSAWNGCWRRNLFLHVSGFPAANRELGDGLASRLREWSQDAPALTCAELLGEAFTIERRAEVPSSPGEGRGDHEVIRPGWRLDYSALSRKPGGATRPKDGLGLDQMLDILEQSGLDSPFSLAVGEMLEKELKPEPLPGVTASAKRERNFLTIGMATYDDYDGVYFSLQAIRFYHPEVLDSVEFLLLDNHPAGPCALPLKSIANHVPNCRYVPFDGFESSAAREMVFREANSEWVLCMDSHVLFPPGALSRLLEYLRLHPDSPNLLQGPMLSDSHTCLYPQLEDRWEKGTWGRWMITAGLTELSPEPFQISMQGLAVFCCRKEAWPGLHPHLRGYGGEEGCLHEIFRAHGGETICLPFLQWIHRLARPWGPRYPYYSRDLLRNYLLFFSELGRDVSSVLEEFRRAWSPSETDETLARFERERASPLRFYAFAVCLLSSEDRHLVLRSMKDHPVLGLAPPRTVVATPLDPEVGRSLSWRTVLLQDWLRGQERLLVLEPSGLVGTDLWLRLEERLEELGPDPQEQHFLLAEGGGQLKVSICTRELCQRIATLIPGDGLEVARWLREVGPVENLIAAPARLVGGP